MEPASVVHGASVFSNDQSPSACFWHSPHEKHGFYHVHFPPGPFAVQDHGSNLDAETLKILPGVDLNLPYLKVKITKTPVSPQKTPIVRTRFELLAHYVDGCRPKKPKTMNL